VSALENGRLDYWLTQDELHRLSCNAEPGHDFPVVFPMDPVFIPFAMIP
jgi:uncharacterized protein YceK